MTAVAACYGYRDIWPLMHYNMEPLDALEGTCLWIKIALVITVGLLWPVLEPYGDIGVDVRLFRSFLTVLY